MYREHLKFNNKNRNNPIQEWAKDLNRQFSRGDVQMTNKHMKRYSTVTSH